MKKTLSVLLLLCLLLPFTAFGTEAAAKGFRDSGRTGSLLLKDLSDGRTLYAKNEKQIRGMGSVTKVMTYILTAECTPDPAHTYVTVDRELFADIEADASLAGLDAYDGKRLSVLDLLYGLMLPSGCDAAAVLAVYAAGSESAFVERMNRKAASLGCTNTRYADPHGLSAENLTTAEDTFTVFAYALTLPFFREIIGSSFHFYGDGDADPVYQTNYLVSTAEGGMYYYPYCVGGKTGYTCEAGKCLVSAAKKGDDEFVCVALGGEYEEDSSYVNFAMTDSAALFDWAFGTFTDNVTVDIPAMFMSVAPGETEKIPFTADANGTGLSAKPTWKSSDPDTVEVDQNGVLTAKKPGSALITAVTVTGNTDSVEVSCGFYNGALITARNVSFAPDGTVLPADWERVAESGLDYVLIRAGWSYEEDAAFAGNVRGAYENGLPYGVTYVTYAETPEEAAADADHLFSLLESAEDCASLNVLPVFYDLVTCADFAVREAEETAAITEAFSKRMEEYGCDTVLLAKYAVSEALCSVPGHADDRFCVSYYPWVVDLSYVRTFAGGRVPFMWEYRNDGFVPGAVRDDTKRTCRNLLYMPSALASLSEISLRAETADGTVALSWSHDTDALTPDGYAVYRDGTLLHQAGADDFTFTDREVQPGETHRYTVAGLFRDPLSGKTAAGPQAPEAAVTVPIPSAFAETLRRMIGFLLELIGRLLFVMNGV